MSPPPFGTNTTTSTAYATIETKFARFWTSKRCCASSRFVKSPSGKRAARLSTTRNVEMRAGQTRSSGVSTSTGTSHATSRPSGSVTSPIAAYIASPTDAMRLVSSGACSPRAFAAKRTIEGPTPKSSTAR